MNGMSFLENPSTQSRNITKEKGRKNMQIFVLKIRRLYSFLFFLFFLYIPIFSSKSLKLTSF